MIVIVSMITIVELMPKFQWTCSISNNYLDIFIVNNCNHEKMCAQIWTSYVVITIRYSSGILKMLVLLLEKTEKNK